MYLLSSNQDDNGGWSVPVEKFLSKKRISLKPGWYSSMAQVGYVTIPASRSYAILRNTGVCCVTTCFIRCGLFLFFSEHAQYLVLQKDGKPLVVDVILWYFV